MTIIEDLIILGKARPSEMRDHRMPICVVGYSPAFGFIRLYPCRYDMPLKRWNIVKVSVERPIKPRHDGRKESWKISYSRNEWYDNDFKDKIKVIDRIPKNEHRELIDSLVTGCVKELYLSGQSIGIIKATIKGYYFEKEDFTSNHQSTFKDGFRILTKDEFSLIPRIKYVCSNCKIKNKSHDQQILEWGVYEYMRKNLHDINGVWNALHLKNKDYLHYFVVGNQYQHLLSYLIISVLRFKKVKGELKW